MGKDHKGKLGQFYVNLAPQRGHIKPDSVKRPYLFEMSIFLGRIRVIEAHNELAIESLLIVLIEEGGLGMTDVQISTGLRREPHDNFALLGSGQLNELALILHPLPGFLGLTGGLKMWSF